MFIERDESNDLPGANTSTRAKKKKKKKITNMHSLHGEIDETIKITFGVWPSNTDDLSIPKIR